MSELPKGWAEVTLGEVAKRITKGATPTSYGFEFQKNGIRFIKIENLAKGRINHSSLRQFICDEAHQNQARSILQEGDILFSIAGSIGTCCLVREEDLPANTNQALAIIRGTNEVFNPRFLQSLLSSKVCLSQVAEKARGGGMNNVSLEDIKTLKVVVPPFNEQKRIVAKLDELLPKVEACKQQLEKIPTILKRFRQSVLAAAVSGRLTGEWRRKNYSDDETENDIPKGWKVIKLGDVIVKLDQGWSPKCENFPAISEAQWAVMKTTAVQPGKFLPDENKQLPSSLEAKPNLEVREGDLLITRAGPRVRCGVTCLVKATRQASIDLR